MILPEVSRREWMDDAACVGIPSEMFVLDVGVLESAAVDKITAALNNACIPSGYSTAWNMSPSDSL